MNPIARTLFLHVGPPKTGTSAVQALLRDHPPPRLLYPRTGQWTDGAHHQISMSLAGRRRYGDIVIAPLGELGGRLIAEMAASDQDVLISSELLLPDQSGRAFFDHFGHQIGRLFSRVVVVFVVRHPLARAASSYNQDVKDPVTGERRDPDVYLLSCASGFAVTDLIDRWAALPCELRMLDYHPADDFVGRFLEVIGHHADATAAIGRPNRSIGGKGLLTLLAANKVLNTYRERQRFFDAIRRNEDFGLWRGPSFPFSADAAAAFERAVSGDLSRLEHRHGIDLSSGRFTVPRRFSLSAGEIGQIWQMLKTIPGIAEASGEIRALLAGFGSD